MKIIGDFFLCANKIAVAIDLYNQSIEIFRSLGDFLWQAACMEALITANVLQELKASMLLVISFIRYLSFLIPQVRRRLVSP